MTNKQSFTSEVHLDEVEAEHLKHFLSATPDRTILHKTVHSQFTRIHYMVNVPVTSAYKNKDPLVQLLQFPPFVLINQVYSNISGCNLSHCCCV